MTTKLTKPARKQPFLHRLARTTLLLLLALGLYACASNVLVHRDDRLAPRNPETGVLLGAEERDLGPTDARGAVLFVHGHLGAGSNFADLPDQAAAAGWHVRVMRLPGHGTSPRDYEKTTPDEMLDAVRAEATDLRTEYGRVIIVGHSMGGALSTLAAAEGDVDGLVLIAPYFGVTYHWYFGFSPETWTRVGSPFLRWLYKGRQITAVRRREALDDIVCYRWAPMSSVVRMQDLARRARDPETLERIECPVLWVHSPTDFAASFEVAQQAVDAMASEHVETAEFPHSDHHLLWDYDREAVKNRVLEFLASPQTFTSIRQD